jgi:hypothetical protein
LWLAQFCQNQLVSSCDLLLLPCPAVCECSML